LRKGKDCASQAPPVPRTAERDPGTTMHNLTPTLTVTALAAQWQCAELPRAHVQPSPNWRTR